MATQGRQSLRPRQISIVQSLPVVHLQDINIDKNSSLEPDELKEFVQFILNEEKCSQTNESEEMDTEPSEPSASTFVDTAKEAIPVPSVIQITNDEDENRFIIPHDYITAAEPHNVINWDKVDYDLEEDDQSMLKIINNHIKKSKNYLSEDSFEKIIDSFEKSFFELLFTSKGQQLVSGNIEDQCTNKKIQKIMIEEKKKLKKSELKTKTSKKDKILKQEKMKSMYIIPSDDGDTLCNVCGNGESFEDNKILYCDGCDVAVHQHCYGVQSIPTDSWYCSVCLDPNPPKNLCCTLCPLKGGAMKRSVEGSWAHVTCAMWLPETNFGDWQSMEPIVGIPNVNPSRWDLKCELCKKSVGACIQCKNRHCYKAFHPSCARKAGLLMEMLDGNKGPILNSYCVKHSKQNHHKKQTKQLLAPVLVMDKSSVISKAILDESHIRTKVSFDLLDKVYDHWVSKRKLKDARCSKWLLRQLQVLSEDIQKMQDLDGNVEGAFVQKKSVAPILSAEMMNMSKKEEYELLKKIRRDFEIARLLLDLCKKREIYKKKDLDQTKDLFKLNCKEQLGLDVDLEAFEEKENDKPEFLTPAIPFDRAKRIPLSLRWQNKQSVITPLKIKQKPIIKGRRVNRISNSSLADDDPDKRVTLWHKQQHRRLAGMAAPKLKNLKDYLKMHPEWEVYAGQDENKKRKREGNNDSNNDKDEQKRKKKKIKVDTTVSKTIKDKKYKNGVPGYSKGKKKMKDIASYFK